MRFTRAVILEADPTESDSFGLVSRNQTFTMLPFPTEIVKTSSAETVPYFSSDQLGFTSVLFACSQACTKPTLATGVEDTAEIA